MIALNDEPEVQFRRKSDPPPNPPTRPHNEDKPSKVSPTLLFLLSLVIPGLGQLLFGFFAQAIVFFAGALGFWYMAYIGIDMFWPIIIAHFGSAISAWMAGKAREI